MKNKNKKNINNFVERKKFSSNFIASYTFDTLNYMLCNHHIKFYFPSKKIWLKNLKIKIYLLINVHTRKTTTTKKINSKFN